MGDFTRRMREAAPMEWLTLQELCDRVGVDSGVLFYNDKFGDAMTKMYELGILREDIRTVYAVDEWASEVTYVQLLHPNLWEEVVGNLKHAEAQCRLGNGPLLDTPARIDSYQQFVKVFSLSRTSKTIELDKSAQSG